MKNTPFDLSVEQRVDPVGMDVENPRLSWKLPDGGARDVAQAAYRIRVATRVERLASPDYWDSGEVQDDRTLDVAYAGAPLEPSAEGRPGTDRTKPEAQGQTARSPGTDRTKP